MNSSTKHINPEILLEQYQAFVKSIKEIMKMLFTEKTENKWIDNYHLIDYDFIKNWKDSIYFEYLEKDNFEKDEVKENNLKYIKENMKEKYLKDLNNESIYYRNPDNCIIDPMKSFVIISDEAWKIFNIKKENLKYNGKVSIKKGNKKIIIKYDDNNYSVKYVNKNIFGEFIIIFNHPQNDHKEKILENVLNNNIFKWMKDVNFNNKEKLFKIDIYTIPFYIQQKSVENYVENESLDLSNDDNIMKLSDYFSLSISNISDSNFLNISNNISSFINPKEVSSIQLNDSNSNFINSLDISIFILIDTDNCRYIKVKKEKKITNVCAVMRCLSRIVPLMKYFTNNIKGNKVFAKFQSNRFINLIRDFFINLYTDEKEPYTPEDFTSYLDSKKKINIYEEQDPIFFLKFIIDYINKKLNKFDNELNFNFNNLQMEEPYNKELNVIINNNNSIISKNILGLMLETYGCHCKFNFEKIKEFTFIDIDFISIIKNFENEGDSMIQKKINEFLEYFFSRQIIGNSVTYEKCPKCGKNAKILKKEIIHYPSYLIVRLNLGEFKEKEGFINKDNMPYYFVNCDKIKELKKYCSNKSLQYNNIGDSIYNLISMIHYTKLEEEGKETAIKFSSFCKDYS